jgi:hypothetical protein
MPCFTLWWRTWLGHILDFSARSAFICWAKGKGDLFLCKKKCWLQLVVDWSVGTVEGKDVSWLGRNRSVRLGTFWCMFCRCHEIRISSGRGIRGGIFRLWSWAMWKWCTRWRHCHSVQSCFNHWYEIFSWDVWAEYVLPVQWCGMPCIARHAQSFFPSWSLRKNGTRKYRNYSPIHMVIYVTFSMQDEPYLWHSSQHAVLKHTGQLQVIYSEFNLRRLVRLRRWMN